MTMENRRYSIRLGLLSAFVLAFTISLPAWNQPRVIEILADKDSHFKLPGQKEHQITVKAGEPLVLHIEARKSRTWSRDGAVHGFTLLRAKDHAKVPGWDFELQPGVQTLNVTAPTEPGEYEVLCTVICSDNHEGMKMKFVVLP